MKLIVADSGPLIAWACSGHIDVLQAIFPEVLIPETVFVECTANTVLPGAQAIAAAVVAGKLQRIPDAPLGVFENLLNVDPGEAAVSSKQWGRFCRVGKPELVTTCQRHWSSRYCTELARSVRLVPND